MPEATEYVLDVNSTAGREMEEAFAEEHNARLERAERAWRYYEGAHDKPLKVQGDGYDDNVVVNHVEAVASRIAGFMIGEGITFDAGGDDTESGADEDIEAMWQANRGEVLKEALILSGAVEGHCIIRLMPSEGDYPKLVRVRGPNFAAFWDAFELSRVLWYRLEHVAGGQGKRIDYVRGRWNQSKGEIEAAEDAWTELVYRAGDVSGIKGMRAKWELTRVNGWEYEWPPIVDWQNAPNVNGYYGYDDLTGAMALNDSLNFILSNAQRIIKHHADPKTIGTGFSAAELVNTAVGGFYTVASADAKIYNLEMTSDGALVQWLTELITGGLWQSAGMVDNSVIKDMVGQLTNFGLRVLYANAIKRTEKKRQLYAEAFDKINRYGMELAGRAVPGRVETVWSDVLPEDEGLVSEVLMRELEAGIISKETYRMLRGYDDEKERARLEEEMAGGNVGAGILGLLATNRAFNRGV